MRISILRLAAFFALAGVSNGALGQNIPPSALPGHERERFARPPPPEAKPAGPIVSLPSTVAPSGAARQKIILKDVRVTGSTVFTPAELRSLYANLLGHKASVQTIYDIARRITAKYGERGYVLSRAIVPPQRFDPKAAVVHLEVIEGYIDKVEWPTAVSRYRDLFSGYAAKIIAARPANIHVIERYLLLAGDLPGLKFSSTLRPSATRPEASTLVVSVVFKPIDAYARLDNYGTRTRGPLEYLTSVTFNNFLRNHGALTLSAAGAFPLRTLQYYDVLYRQVLTDEGLTAYVHASYSWGWPGTQPLELLDFKARSLYIDSGLSYPIIRSRERDLTLTGLAFLSNNNSDVLGAVFNEDRLRGLRVKADADMVDGFRGTNQGNLTFSQGFVGAGSTTDGNPLASRAAGRVDFSKFEASLNRTQPLFDRFSAFAAAYGQYAFDPLLSPEQCSYGGRYFGRAFATAEFLGDSCWELSGEIRYDLPLFVSWAQQVQLYGFSDYGHLYTRGSAFLTPANIDAASVGGGMRLGLTRFVKADVVVAKATAGPRQDWRVLFSIAASY